MSADRVLAAFALVVALVAGGVAVSARQDADRARSDAAEARAAESLHYGVSEPAVGNLQRRMWEVEKKLDLDRAAPTGSSPR